MIVFFLIIIQSIIALGHYSIYYTLTTLFNVSNPTALVWLQVIHAMLAFSFVVMSVVTYRVDGPIIRTLYKIAAVWLGTFYWLLIATALTWIIFGVMRFFGVEKSITYFAGALFATAIIISAYGVWNSFQTKVLQATVALPNLPKQWKGRKVVLLADTHFGSVRGASTAQKVADLVQAQNPDLVLIPGDFYDGPLSDYAAEAKPFGKIKSTFGVYFAAGNHEEYRDRVALNRILSDAGVHVLTDSMEVVDGLQIVGVNYSSTIKPGDQKKVLDAISINKNVTSVLIKHVPNNINVAEAAGINLQVSGHTHRGQMVPFAYITRLLYGKFAYGLSPVSDTSTMQVYTTGGVGTWGPPQRVGTHSEIVVITLE